MEESLPIDIFFVQDSADNSTTRLNGQFVYSQMLIDCLLRMGDSTTDNNEFILLCRKEYEDNNSQLAILREFEQYYSPDDAIWWYSRDSFFYKILNKALRTQNIYMLFLLRSFISDIYRQLQYYQSECRLRVYRSQLMSSDELNNLKQSINQFISINSFLSTSIQRDVACIYMSDSTSSDNLQRVLFDIDADPRLITKKPFADIRLQSQFVDEEEVLFMLGCIFRIVNVSCDDDHIWIVRMTLCGDDDHDLKKVLLHMKQQLGSEEPNFRTLGKIVWTMGKFDLAQEFYHRLLNELPPDDPLLKSVYEDLAEITSQNHDYDISIQWRHKVVELMERTPPIHHINITARQASNGKFIQES